MGDLDYDDSGLIFKTSPSTNNFQFINGNVGIGTTTPNEALTVEGDISASGDITIDYNKALVWKAANNSIYNRIDSNHVSGYYSIRYRSNGGDNDATSIMHQWFTNKGGVSDTSVMALSRGGLLGIGTTTPNEALTVSGSISASGDLYLDGNIYDVNNSTGSSGQVLSSTTAGVDWIDNAGSGVTGSWSNHDYITVTSGSGAINDSQYAIAMDQSSSISGSNQSIYRQSHFQQFYRGEGEQTLSTEGTHDLFSVEVNKAAAMFVDYLAFSGSAQKVGTITGTSGGALSETTASVGNTSDIEFGFTFASNTMKLQATTTALDWQVSYHYRVLTNYTY
jgi:ethanolamine utilization microcompartment shell protein EutS